jgi:hypothetical protein
MDNQIDQSKWYNKTWLVITLCIFILPVGIYALWKNQSISKGWKITVVVIIALIAIANFGKDDKNSFSNQNVVTNKEPEKEPAKELTQAQKDSIAAVERANLIEERKNMTISAAQLIQAYTDNEVSADNNLKGEKFYVEGIIDNIGKDILGSIYVTLKSGDIIRSVQCYIDDQEKVAELRKGQKITVFGKCDGMMMNVLMKNCKLVENKENL